MKKNELLKERYKQRH